MSNLIYQYYNDDSRRKQSAGNIGLNYPKLSKRSISKYAKMLGCEYRLMTKDVPFSSLYGIFLPFLQGWCHDYESICWIDSDIVSTTNGCNVFEQCEVGSLTGMCMNSANAVTNPVPYAPEPFGTMGHVNSGVIVFHKDVYDSFTKYIMDEWVAMEYTHKKTKDIWDDYNPKMVTNKDQELINNFIVETKKFKPLDSKFNWILNRFDVSMRWDQQFIHYIGRFKSKLEIDFEDPRILK